MNPIRYRLTQRHFWLALHFVITQALLDGHYRDDVD